MKRRLKKEVKVGLVIIGIIILILIVIKILNNRNSTEFKLSKIGYSKKDISVILKLKDNEINDLLNEYDYDKNMISIINEKYFMFKNLDRYLSYYKKNTNLPIRSVVEIVNVNRDKSYYTDIKSTDITKGELALLNKYYGLNKEYKPNDLKSISLQYAYTGNKLVSYANEKFVELVIDSKKLEYSLIAKSSFRDYTSQDALYKKEEKINSKETTDKVIARPGHSEHQLGLALDIDLYKKKYDKFEDTDEYKWLIDNSYKYGFILRYPKDKENITGYLYEPWHFRYVGEKIAKYIHENNITFDEYYAYYIEK